jgi:hypothetical protein
MDLGMFDRLYPSLKTRALIDERKFDMNRSNRYVIPMHRKNVWTNKLMQDPRKIFLQASYHDLGASVQKKLGIITIKRGLTLCYSCRILGHIAKDLFPWIRSIYFPRMIAKLERMNLNEENRKADPEIVEP